MRRALIASLLCLIAVRAASAEIDFATVWNHDEERLYEQLVLAVNERSYALFRDRQGSGTNIVERYFSDPIDTNVYEVAWHPDGTLFEYNYVSLGSNVVTELTAFAYEMGEEPHGWIWVTNWNRIEVAAERAPFFYHRRLNRPVLFKPAPGKYIGPLYRITPSSVVAVDFREAIIRGVNRLSRQGFFMKNDPVSEQLLTEIAPRVRWGLPPNVSWQYIYYHDGTNSVGSPPAGHWCDFAWHPNAEGNSCTMGIIYNATNSWHPDGFEVARAVFPLSLDDTVTSNTYGAVGRRAEWEWSFQSDTSSWTSNRYYYAITNHHWPTNYTVHIPITNISIKTDSVPFFEAYFRAGSNWVVTTTNNGEVRAVSEHQEMFLEGRELAHGEYGLLNTLSASETAPNSFLIYHEDELSIPRYSIRYVPTQAEWEWPEDSDKWKLGISHRSPIEQVQTGTVNGVFGTLTSWTLNQKTNTTELSENEIFTLHDIVGVGPVVSGFSFPTNPVRFQIDRNIPDPWPAFPWGSFWAIHAKPLPSLIHISPIVLGTGNRQFDGNRDWIVACWRILKEMQRTRLSSMGYHTNFVHTIGTNIHEHVIRRVSTSWYSIGAPNPSSSVETNISYFYTRAKGGQNTFQVHQRLAFWDRGNPASRRLNGKSQLGGSATTALKACIPPSIFWTSR